jgi:predicted  nucleic acid-binding Zn-ribbon protein
MPEIFDSSRANAMDEMKESATMQQRDLTKTLSHVQRQEPIQPESVVTKPTREEATNMDLPTINPTIEERASVVKESGQASPQQETSLKIIWNPRRK